MLGCLVYARMADSLAEAVVRSRPLCLPLSVGGVCLSFSVRPCCSLAFGVALGGDGGAWWWRRCLEEVLGGASGQRTLVVHRRWLSTCRIVLRCVFSLPVVQACHQQQHMSAHTGARTHEGT